MSKIDKWIQAALEVADTENMGDEVVIPTWPRECVNSGRYPELTVGALREWQADRAQEGGQAVPHDWVDCPVCGEPDMQRTFHERGTSLIHCCNHGCRSNGGACDTNPGASLPDGWSVERTKSGGLLVKSPEGCMEALKELSVAHVFASLIAKVFDSNKLQPAPSVPDGYALVEKGFTPIHVVEAGVNCLHALKAAHIIDTPTVAAAVFQDMLLAVTKDEATMRQPAGDDWNYEVPPKDGTEFLAFDPDLVDPDFCPDGIVLAMWAEQVQQVAPDRFNDGFIGTVWNEGRDDWQAQVINPVCWMRKPAMPNDQESKIEN